MIDAIHVPFARIVSAAGANTLLGMAREAWDSADERDGGLRERLVEDAGELGRAVHTFGAEQSRTTPVEHFVSDLDGGLSLAVRFSSDPGARSLPRPDSDLWLMLLGWLALRGLGGPSGTPDRNLRCRERMRDWGLDALIAAAFRQLGRTDAGAKRGTEAVAAILTMPMWSPNRPTADVSAVLASWLGNEDARSAMGIHRPQRQVDRYDSEAFRELVAWTTWVAAIRLAEYPPAYERAKPPMLEWVTAISRGLLRESTTARERVDGLLG